MKRIAAALLAVSFLAAFPLHGWTHSEEGAAHACAAAQTAKSAHAAGDGPVLAFQPVAACEIAAEASLPAAPRAEGLPHSRAPPFPA